MGPLSLQRRSIHHTISVPKMHHSTYLWSGDHLLGPSPLQGRDIPVVGTLRWWWYIRTVCPYVDHWVSTHDVPPAI